MRPVQTSFALIVLFATASLVAQTNVFPTTGNVGIGTTSPGNKLTIVDDFAAGGYGTVIVGGTGAARDILLAGQAGFSNGFTVQYTGSAMQYSFTDGNVGIGITSPGSKLDVAGQVTIGNGGGDSLHIGNNQFIKMANTSGAQKLLLGISTNDETYLRGATVLHLQSADGGQEVTVSSNGNVGIGTTNPTQKLSVNGTIQAKEVIVQTGWSDYVLKPDYKLASLSEVEAHIKAHGHLPGVPSEAQVAKEGVTLGEMQAKLLAKIEELTLHQIEQEKEMGRLRSALMRLSRETFP